MVDRITIRMYEVGFGDCFLLTFWTGAKPAARVGRLRQYHRG